MAININTTASSAMSDLMALALEMGSQGMERKWRSEEAQRDRDFRESQAYLQNMLNQENFYIESIFKAEDEANDLGINVKEPMDRLAKFQQQNSTSNGQKTIDELIAIKQDRINQLVDIRTDVGRKKGLYRQGESFGSIMNTIPDGILDENEILAFQDKERIRLDDPSYILPEPFVKGAKASVSSPEVRFTELQLAGEETRQSEFKLEMERQKTAAEQVTSKFQLDLANMYRGENIFSMKGTMSAADYELSSGIHQSFKGMSKAEIFEMIENSPATYVDQVPGELDYSDIDAIKPQMRGFVVHYLNQRPDIQEFLGISQEDFDAEASGDAASDNFNFAVQQGVQNALSGFEQNPNYELRTELIVGQAKAAEIQVQEAATKDLRASYAATIPTLQNYFYVDPESGGIPNIQRLLPKLMGDKAFVAKAEKIAGGRGRSAVETYVESLIVPLTAQVDPTTVNLLIDQSEDIKKIIDAAGLQGMEEVVDKAIKAKNVVKTKYTPVERPSVQERKRIKAEKKVSTSNIEYVKDITEKYKGELSDLKLIGLGLIRDGYDPNSVQYKTMLLQGLSLKLLETTDQARADSIRSEIELLQEELDKII